MTRDSLPDRLAQALNPLEPTEPVSQDFTPAAVLIPLLQEQGQWSLLFTRRTDQVESHRGQVAFPGGVIDPQDEGPVAAALRETQEEIGVPAEAIRVLGLLEPMPTVTEFCVTPVVGLLQWPTEIRINPDEVAATFIVPIAWLEDPRNLEVRYRDSGLQVDFFKPFQNEVIWGATARITLKFLSIIHELPS